MAQYFLVVGTISLAVEEGHESSVDGLTSEYRQCLLQMSVFVETNYHTAAHPYYAIEHEKVRHIVVVKCVMAKLPRVRYEKVISKGYSAVFIV